MAPGRARYLTIESPTIKSCGVVPVPLSVYVDNLGEMRAEQTRLANLVDTVTDVHGGSGNRAFLLCVGRSDGAVSIGVSEGDVTGCDAVGSGADEERG